MFAHCLCATPMRHRPHSRYLVVFSVNLALVLTPRFTPFRYSKLYHMWITVCRDPLMLYQHHTCIDHKYEFAHIL